MKKRRLSFKIASLVSSIGLLPMVISCNKNHYRPEPVKKVTISFECYGGEFEDDVREIEVDINSTWDKIEKLAPKCREYDDTTFAGWYFQSEDGSIIKIEPNTYFDKSVTIFALVISNYGQIDGPDTWQKFGPCDSHIISGFGKFQAKIGPYIPKIDQKYNELADWGVAAYSDNVKNLSCKTEVIEVDDQQQIYITLNGQMVNCYDGEKQVDISLSFYNSHSSINPIGKKLTILYQYRSFDWKKFVAPSDTSTDVESDWEILVSALNGGYTAKDIILGISKSTGEEFSWEKEYLAKINVNGKMLYVRLIGLENDVISKSKNPATMTWEFLNVICDENGEYLYTKWNADKLSSENYYESTVNKRLNSDESMSWTTKKIEGPWGDKSVLNMLPVMMKKAIVNVDKRINIWKNGKWTHEQAQPVKLFLPTYANFYSKEDIEKQIKHGSDEFSIANIGEGGMTDDTAQYPFYKNHLWTTVEDCPFRRYKYGYHSGEENATAYWLASLLLIIVRMRFDAVQMG